MQRSLRVSTAVVLTVSATAFVACGPMGPYTGEAHESWSRTYDITKTGEVSIVNVNGRVEVEGVDGSKVEVQADRIVHATTDQLARELLPKISINEHSTPDLVQVETGRVAGILIGASFEVRYHVKTPRSAVVRVSTVNGGVEVRSLGGRTSVRTTNGSVVAKNISGGLEARTVNGGVRAALGAIGTNDITLSTVNGSIRLVVPESAKATVNATWVNGSFNSGGMKFEVRDSGKRHFEGLLNGGGTPLNVNTVNGGIRMASVDENDNDDDSGGDGHESRRELRSRSSP